MGSAREVTGERQLAAGIHFVRVEYFERTGEALIQVTWERIRAVGSPDWKGEYWPIVALSGDPILTRNDENINFD